MGVLISERFPQLLPIGMIQMSDFMSSDFEVRALEIFDLEISSLKKEYSSIYSVHMS